MPIDANIPLKAQTPDLVGAAYKGSHVGLNILQQAMLQDKRNSQNALAHIMQANTSPEGKVNWGNVIGQMAQNPFTAASVPEMAEKKQKFEYSEHEAKHKRHQEYAGHLSELLKLPFISDDHANNFFINAIKNGDLTPQEQEQELMALPPERDQAARRAYIQHHMESFTNINDQFTQDLKQQQFEETQRKNQVTEQQAQSRLGLEQQRLSQDKQMPKGQVIQTPDGFALVNPYTGQATPVTNNQGETVKSKVQIEHEAELQRSISLGQSTLDSTNRALGYLDRLIKNKDGLNGIVGSVYSTKPSVLMTDQELAARSDLDSINAKEVMNLMAEMRASSKVGATGFGNMNEKELKIIEDGYGNIKRDQPYVHLFSNLQTVHQALSALRNKAPADIDRAQGQLGGSSSRSGPVLDKPSSKDNSLPALPGWSHIKL